MAFRALRLLLLAALAPLRVVALVARRQDKSPAASVSTSVGGLPTPPCPVGGDDWGLLSSTRSTRSRAT